MINEIKFTCSTCGQHIACAAEHAGIAIACPGCQTNLFVPQAPILTAPVIKDGDLRMSRPDRVAWKNMGLGLGIAILAAYIPFLSWVFQYLSTIIHELGHWIVAMAFGYPSVPAFHVVSGGVTIAFSRMPLLLLAVYASLGWILFHNRSNRMALIVLSAITVGYAVLAHSGLDKAIVLAAGHFTELLIAGVFLFRGWSGASILAASERPLYAAVGLYMVGMQLGFAMGVLFSNADRRLYIEREGEGNDFVRLSEQLGVSMDLFIVLVLLAALAVPWLSYLASCHQARGRWILKRLFVR